MTRTFIRFERPRIAAEFRALVASLDKPDPAKPAVESKPVDLSAPLTVSSMLEKKIGIRRTESEPIDLDRD